MQLKLDFYQCEMDKRQRGKQLGVEKQRRSKSSEYVYRLGLQQMTGKEIKTPCLIPHQDHYGPRDAAHAPVDARQAAGSEHYAVADLYAQFRAQTILRGDYSL